MKKISTQEIEALAKNYGVEAAALKAILSVEASGHGFDPETGKIIIQFEPHVFHRELKKRGKLFTLLRVLIKEKWKYKLSGVTAKGTPIEILNGVEGQEAEWKAFNLAWAVHPECAMLATSWGLMQIMGFNYGYAGFHNVGDMVDSFKEGEYQQVCGGLKFIQYSNRNLWKALVNKDWTTFASIYNGPSYEKFNYHTRMKKAYETFKNSLETSS